MAEDKALSREDKLLVKQTRKQLKEETTTTHVRYANLRSFPLTHFLRQNSSFPEHKFFQFLLPQLQLLGIQASQTLGWIFITPTPNIRDLLSRKILLLNTPYKNEYALINLHSVQCLNNLQDMQHEYRIRTQETAVSKTT